MTNEQREEFLRRMTAGVKEAEQAYLALSGKAATQHLKKLFEELVLAPVRAQQENESTMTPREQIQEHARVAAKKVKEAMTEFASATGMQAQVHVSWVQHYSIDSEAPVNALESVTIQVDDEVRA